MSQRTPRIGRAIQKTRKQRKLTLEQLASLSGVSKSMLSQIERNEVNPTFAVVWSLTLVLEITFSDLVGGRSDTSLADEIEVTPKAHTPEIRSPDGLCRLKILSPPQLAGQTEWYDLEMEPGGRLESAPHTSGTTEHFTAFTDGFEITSGPATTRLRESETARYSVDLPHCIANIGGSRARGFLIVIYK